MRITITARHTEIDDDLRAHTKELVEKVAKLARRPHHAQVIFTDDHGEAAVEIAVHVPRGRIHVAKSQAADHRSALDAAIARIKRQLLDALDERPGAVGVLLAEVVRAGGKHGDRLAGPVHAARPQVVENGVVPLGETLADFGPALVLRRVHAVAAEPLAQIHHALGIRVREQWIEQDVLVESHANDASRQPSSNRRSMLRL